MRRIFIADSPGEMRRFASVIARTIRGGDVLALEGELGSGKTTFVQGLASALGIPKKVLSPTFVVIKSFRVSRHSFSVLHHMDCYRLLKPSDVLLLSFRDMLDDLRAVTIIEWADRIRALLPPRRLTIRFRITGETQRMLTVIDERGCRCSYALGKRRKNILHH